MSVEETQKLVTQPYHNPQAKQIIEKLNITQLTRRTNSKLINENCLIALHTHNFTFDLGVASFIAFSLGLMYVFVFQRELPLLLQIPVSYFIVLNPIRVFNVISGTFEKGVASVFTLGTHGIQRATASMYTVYGFTGIKLMPHPIRSNEAFYLGGALLMIAQKWMPNTTLQ